MRGPFRGEPAGCAQIIGTVLPRLIADNQPWQINRRDCSRNRSTPCWRRGTGKPCAMFSAIMVATTLGLLLPFLFRRLGIDPAISSGPLVTAANDSISVAIYMRLTILLAG